MKKLPILLVLLVLPLLTWAQTKVNASEILAKINNGEAVTYKNAEIVGDLDLTKLKNMKLKEGKESKYETKEYTSTVTSPLTFENCTFKGDVLAYFNPEASTIVFNSKNEVYNTHFTKDVRFESCTFEEASAFKYAEFKQGVSFAGSRFSEEANFKYTKFSKTVNFSKATFRNDANFKYVDFPVMANFRGADFADAANFKYAKFMKGADFSQADFNSFTDFKYAKISDSFRINGASFKGSQDFKYTKLDNKAVSLSALQSMSK